MPRELGIGIRAAHQCEQRILFPRLGGAARRDLLSQDIEWGLGHLDAVEPALEHPAHERSALDEVVATEREQAPLGYRAEEVAGAADALDAHRQRAGRADLADQLHCAEVHSQLERGGGHGGLDLRVLELLLGEQPLRSRQAAVVRRHQLLPDAFLERAGHAFHQAPRVDEDERGAVRGDQLGEAVVDLRPLLGGGHGGELAARDLDVQVELARLALVHYHTVRLALSVDVPRAHEEARDFLDGILRGGEADPLQLPVRQRLESLQRERKMRAASVIGERVAHVDDDGAHRPE